jgi:hypothetical protein
MTDDPMMAGGGPSLGGAGTGGSRSNRPTDVTGNPLPDGDPPPDNCLTSSTTSFCIGDTTGKAGQVIEVPLFVDLGDCGELTHFNLNFDPPPGLELTLMNPINGDSEEEDQTCTRRYAYDDGFYVLYSPTFEADCSPSEDDQGGFLILQFAVDESTAPGTYEWLVEGFFAYHMKDGNFCAAEDLRVGSVTIVP